MLQCLSYYGLTKYFDVLSSQDMKVEEGSQVEKAVNHVRGRCCWRKDRAIGCPTLEVHDWIAAMDSRP